MNPAVSIRSPRGRADFARTLLRVALVVWASIWTALLVWAVCSSWLLTRDPAASTKSPSSGTLLLVAAALLLLWSLVVLVLKRPAIGAIGLLAFATFALFFFHETTTRLTVALPALIFGAGFARLAWRNAR